MVNWCHNDLFTNISIYPIITIQENYFLQKGIFGYLLIYTCVKVFFFGIIVKKVKMVKL